MRLVLIIRAMGSGGAERAITVLANYWAARGHSIILLTFDAGEPPFYPLHPRVEYRALGVDVAARARAARLLYSATRIRRLRAELSRIRPDAVISFTYIANVVVLLATLGTGIPLVVSERVDPGWKIPVERIWKILRHMLYPRACAVVTQTERIAGYFRPRLNGNLVVIPNPVLPPPEDGADGVADEVTPIGKKTVVAVGRFDPQKGFDMLLRAFAAAGSGHPDWDLVIIGEGPERGLLTTLARDLGMEHRVSFPGRVKSPYAVLKKAGLYVLSSRFEGFPNALGEAMACGLPVVAMDCPTGPREIITDGVDGLLVPDEDVPALARAMERMMGDEALREELGRRARAVTERFAIDVVTGRWEALLRDRCGVGA